MRQLFVQGNKVDFLGLRRPFVCIHTTSLLAYLSLTVCDLRHHIQRLYRDIKIYYYSINVMELGDTTETSATMTDRRIPR